MSDSTRLKLKIVSPAFGLTVIEVPIGDEVGLKRKVFLGLDAVTGGRFSSFQGISDNVINSFRMTRTMTKKFVDDFETLQKLKVQNGEEFLLLVNRWPLGDPIDYMYLNGPTDEEILNRTSSIKQTPTSPPTFKVTPMLMQDDMRKVFVTLALECAFVLGMTPLADKLISYFQKRIHYYIKNHKNAEKVMVQLGFKENVVKHALKLKAFNYRLALDWLIENETSVGFETVNATESPRASNTQRTSSSRNNSILSSKYLTPTRNCDRVDGLLEIVKFYADKDELVYEENIDEMVSMGYEGDEAREALRLTRNNIGAAIAQIHGDKSPSITELRNGFSSLSPLRHKILESPQILKSFMDPQAFCLYINILDNPTQANAWNPTSEVGELLTHIIITYHEEKHATAQNQFNGSRVPISALSSPNWKGQQNMQIRRTPQN